MFAHTPEDRLNRGAQGAFAHVDVWETIHARVDAVGNGVILSRLVVATLLGHLLEALLLLGVCVADLERETLLTKQLTIELSNDIVTFLAVLESGPSTKVSFVPLEASRVEPTERIPLPCCCQYHHAGCGSIPPCTP